MGKKGASLQWWITVLVLLSVVSFLITGVLWLLSPASLAPKIIVDSGTVSNGANVVADYLAVRHIVLGAIMLTLFLIKKYRVLGYFLLAGGVVQALDAVLDIVHNDVPSGPVILTIVNLTAAYVILCRKFITKDSVK